MFRRKGGEHDAAAGVSKFDRKGGSSQLKYFSEGKVAGGSGGSPRSNGWGQNGFSSSTGSGKRRPRFTPFFGSSSGNSMEMDSTSSTTFRMLVLGHSCVGKTSLCNRYTSHQAPRHYQRTHRIQYYAREISGTRSWHAHVNRRSKRLHAYAQTNSKGSESNAAFHHNGVDLHDSFERKRCVLPRYAIQVLDIPGIPSEEISSLERTVLEFKDPPKSEGLAFGETNFLISSDGSHSNSNGRGRSASLSFAAAAEAYNKVGTKKSKDVSINFAQDLENDYDDPTSEDALLPSPGIGVSSSSLDVGMSTSGTGVVDTTVSTGSRGGNLENKGLTLDTEGIYSPCRISAYIIVHKCPETGYTLEDDSIFAHSFKKAKSILHYLMHTQCQTLRQARHTYECRKIFFIFGNMGDLLGHGGGELGLSNEEARTSWEKVVHEQLIRPFKERFPDKVRPKVIYTVGSATQNKAWIRLGPTEVKEVTIDEYFDYCANIMHKLGHGRSSLKFEDQNARNGIDNQHNAERSCCGQVVSYLSCGMC
eukprot:g670.t1